MQDGDVDEKLLGVYSSREKALARQAQSLELPGFRDHPGEFLVDEYTIDRDQWTDGYQVMNDGQEA